MLSQKKLVSINIFSKERYFSLGLLLVGVVFVFLLIITFFNPFNPKNREATLALSYENDGRGRVFTGEVIKNMTILEALIASSRAGQIELKYALGSDGKLIIAELDGYSREASGKRLVFYLNQKRIDEVLISSTTIKSADYIEVKLE